MLVNHRTPQQELERLRVREQGLLAEIADVRRKVAELERKQRLAPPLQVVPEPTPEVQELGPRFRRCVRELGSFTTGELMAEIGLSRQQTSKRLAALEVQGMVKRTGKFGKDSVWEYVPPTEPGQAALTDLARRKSLPSPEQTALAGATITARKIADHESAVPIDRRLVASMSAKESKKAAMEAIARGWALKRTGGNHFLLKKGDRSVSVSLTPQNDSSHAARIRRQTA